MKKIKIGLLIAALNLGVSGVAMAIDWNSNSSQSIPTNNTRGFIFCIPCII